MPEGAGRWGTRMIDIPSEDRFLMFGGSQYPVGETNGDLWSFSLVDETWTKIEATGDLPAPRYCHCATYLPDQHQMLMVGGRDDFGPRIPEAFLFDITANNWTKLSGPVPRGVIGCAIEWMDNLGRAAVFGGAGGSALFEETWLYDPGSMSFSMVPTSSTPPGRADGAHAYDPIKGRMLIFGGGVRVVPPYNHLGDTWAFDGTNWTELTPAVHPTKRRFGANGVDPDTGSWYLTGAPSKKRIATTSGASTSPPIPGASWKIRHPPRADSPQANGIRALRRCMCSVDSSSRTSAQPAMAGASAPSSAPPIIGECGRGSLTGFGCCRQIWWRSAAISKSRR